MKNYIFCLITILFFSTLEFTGKIIGNEITPIAVTAYRFLLGGLLIFPFAIAQIIKNKTTFSTSDFIRLSIPGILNVGISMFFLQLAIFYGKASLSAIIISSNPIFVGILSWFILKEKVSKEKFIGIILGVLGIILIISTDNHSLNETKNAFLGVVFALLSAVTFAIYTLITKKYIKKYGNLVLNSFSFIIGSLLLMTVALIIKQKLSFEISLTNIISISYLGIFVTGVAYLLFFEALKHIPAATGSMFFFLKPVFASVLAFFILKESISFIQIIGVIIIIFGMSLEKIASIWKIPFKEHSISSK